MTLDDFVTQLRAAYGDGIQAIVLYGSAVAGEHHKQRSDYNVVVIADRFPNERRSAAAAVLRAWREAGNPPPMMFTQEEWRNSADVFPMEYADIIARHRVLAGDPQFDQIQVDPTHLRLHVEREALGMVFRLRRAAILAGMDGVAELAVLTESLSALMIIFRGVLRLQGDTPPQNYDDLVRDVAARTGIDPAPFHEVIHHVRGERKLPKDRVDGVLAGYVRGMEAVAAYVDRL